MEEAQTKLNNGLAVGVFVSAVVFVLLAGWFFNGFVAQYNRPRVVLVGQTIEVEVVKDSEDMVTGLSDHESLDEDAGMLFLLGGYYIPSFWMKDMDFAIDIIFIKDDLVSSYNKNVQPETGENLTKYRPKTFVNMVLEVNSGFIDKYNLKIGDKVEFKNIDKNNNKVLEY